MSQFYRYPAAASVTIAAIGPNGSAIPTSSILVAGEDPSLDLKPLQTTAGGSLKVDVSGSTPPTGAATSANQVLEIAELTAIDGKLPATLGQKAMAASLAVAIASDQSAVPISAASLPLPSGAATAANQATLLTRLSGSLVPAAFDEIDLTYVAAGAGTGQIATAVYKLASATVKTLTMSYDGSDRLSSVVAS